MIMALIENLFEAAAHAGFLKPCVWRPSDGSPEQAHAVGFAAPDETLLDGLTLSTEYVMSYPASVLVGLVSAEMTCCRPSPSRLANLAHGSTG